MIVYAVFRERYNRKECAGVWTVKEKAIEVARTLIAVEVDDYHNYSVVPVGMDELPNMLDDSDGGCPFGERAEVVCVSRKNEDVRIIGRKSIDA
jgi:hypothetical protein